MLERGCAGEAEMKARWRRRLSVERKHSIVPRRPRAACLPRSCLEATASASRVVKLRVMPENARLVERQTTLGSQIRGDVRQASNRIAHRGELGVAVAEAFHRTRKSIKEALEELEHR